MSAQPQPSMVAASAVPVCQQERKFAWDISHEAEIHIYDLGRLWRMAYARFQALGVPCDREEAALWLRMQNDAILSRSQAEQARRHAEFERRLDEGVDYFQVQGARDLQTMEARTCGR